MQKHSRKMKKALESFAADVRLKRENKGLSRRELSAELDINQLTLRNLERGKTVPMLDTAMVVAAELGIKLDRIAKLATGA